MSEHVPPPADLRPKHSDVSEFEWSPDYLSTYRYRSLWFPYETYSEDDDYDPFLEYNKCEIEATTIHEDGRGGHYVDFHVRNLDYDHGIVPEHNWLKEYFSFSRTGAPKEVRIENGLEVWVYGDRSDDDYNTIMIGK